MSDLPFSYGDIAKCRAEIAIKASLLDDLLHSLMRWTQQFDEAENFDAQDLAHRFIREIIHDIRETFIEMEAAKWDLLNAKFDLMNKSDEK